MTNDAPAHHGPIARYRSWYERLPTGMQMIGLQVWLPVFFVIAFVFCYVLAFHAPALKDVPVALVGPAAQLQPVADQLGQQSAGALDVRVEPSEAAARAAVRSSELAAAYVPGAPAADGTSTATLIIASADSYQLSSLAKQVFVPLATAQKATLQYNDIAPLPAWDSFGTTLFYLTLLCTISGYMMGMFVGMMGGGLTHRQRFAIFGASSVLLPGLAVLLTRFAVHAVHGHGLELWLIGAATSFAIGCVVNGLAYYVGRFVTGYALLFFVFANVPSSGGAYPPELVPQPFRFLHDFVSGTATVDLFRSRVYGVGPAEWRGWLALAVYAAVGVALALAGKPFAAWKAARRRRLGRRPPMMAVAQASSLIGAGLVTARHPHLKKVAPAPATAAVPEVGAVAAPVDRLVTDATGAIVLPKGHGRRALPVDEGILKAETQALEIIQQDARREVQAGAEEADADAVAAETGAAG